MGACDRGHYVSSRGSAYVDAPQSIGCNATISAPHMHAYALDLLAPLLRPGAKVLDVGCGSGYLAACMAHMTTPGGKVIALDHIDDLVSLSKKNVAADHPEWVQDGSITFVVGDGRDGYPQEAPYDVIHVGAAAPTLPQAVRDPGAQPLLSANQGGMQYLYKISKDADGRVTKERLMGVGYIPLTDKEAQSLARAGKTVLHIDQQSTYGGEWRTFTLQQLRDLAHGGQQDGCFSAFLEKAYDESFVADTSAQRRLVIELAPKLLFCNGSMVNLFTTSGVGRYLDFKLLEGMHMVYDGKLEQVPVSKERVFANKTISLPDKRRLMKVLTQAASATPGPSTVEDITMTAGLERVRRFLTSIGRFGPSPFLCTMYGGGSEIAQALCRVCAVYGGTYMLNQNIQSVKRDQTQSRWTITLAAHGDELDAHSFTCDRIVASPNFAHLLPESSAEAGSLLDEASSAPASRAVVITNASLFDDAETGMVVVPASSTSSAVVKVVQMSSDLQVCPKGYYLLYFLTTAIQDDPYDDILPAMKQLLSLEGEPHRPQAVYAFFYRQSPRQETTASESIVFTADPSCDADFDRDVDRVQALWQSLSYTADLPFLEPMPDPEAVVEATNLTEPQRRLFDLYLDGDAPQHAKLRSRLAQQLRQSMLFSTHDKDVWRRYAGLMEKFAIANQPERAEALRDCLAQLVPNPLKARDISEEVRGIECMCRVRSFTNKHTQHRKTFNVLQLVWELSDAPTSAPYIPAPRSAPVNRASPITWAEIIAAEPLVGEHWQDSIFDIDYEWEDDSLDDDGDTSTAKDSTHADYRARSTPFAEDAVAHSRRLLKLLSSVQHWKQVPTLDTQAVASSGQPFSIYDANALNPSLMRHQIHSMDSATRKAYASSGRGITSEPALVRESLLMLAGNASCYYAADPTDAAVIHPTLPHSLTHLSDGVLTSVAANLASFGSNLAWIRSFCQRVKESSRHSVLLVLGGFISAVEEQLQRLGIALSEMELAAQCGHFVRDVRLATLLSLENMLSTEIHLFGQIKQFMSAIALDQNGLYWRATLSGRLLTSLYERVDAAHAVSSSEGLRFWLHAMVMALDPYMRWLSEWLAQGYVEHAEQEFFVTSVTHLAYWKPFSITFSERLAACIDAACSSAAGALVRALLSEGQLQGHLNDLWQVLLMQAGSAWNSFFLDITSAIKHRKLWNDLSNLQAEFRKCLLQAHVDAELFGLAEATGAATDSSAPSGDIFGRKAIQYEVPWFLSAVITSSHLQGYNDCFRLLARIKHAQHLLLDNRYPKLKGLDRTILDALLTIVNLSTEFAAVYDHFLDAQVVTKQTTAYTATETRKCRSRFAHIGKAYDDTMHFLVEVLQGLAGKGDFPHLEQLLLSLSKSQ
ncbi:hypothetical protein RI367_005292 [Sorochytrium milnesiophthora]